MKVRGAAEIVQVEMRTLQIESGARIGQNLAFLGKRKDHRHAGILTGKAFHARNVNAAFRQTLHTKFAEWITSDARGETNAAAQEGNIVGQDCRRAAEGHRKTVSQMFSLGFKDRRKTVQNQITIEFPQNAYVKTLHWSSIPLSTAVLSEHLAQCAKHLPAQCGRGMPRGNSPFRKQPRATGFAQRKDPLRQRRLVRQEPHHRSRRWILGAEESSRRELPADRVFE